MFYVIISAVFFAPSHLGRGIIVKAEEGLVFYLHKTNVNRKVMENSCRVAGLFL